jgi:uncharacterized protein (TIGR02145 family)
MWTAGAQTWSGAISHPVAGCTQSTDFGTTNPPTTAYYRSEGLEDCSGYLYNWKCVNEQKSKMCPSPWRVPTQADFIALDIALGGNGGLETMSLQQAKERYVNPWGACLAGFAQVANIVSRGTAFFYWTGDYTSGDSGNYFRYNEVNGNKTTLAGNYKSMGCQVRCVR